MLEGIERLIRATVAHHPAAFFAYREPQVYRPEYLAAQKKLAHHFYDLLCPLLEQARRDGDLEFDETKITALGGLQPAGLPLQLVLPGRTALARRSGGRAHEAREPRDRAAHRPLTTHPRRHTMKFHPAPLARLALACLIATGAAGTAQAQQTYKLAYIDPLSGPSPTSAS